MYEQAEKTKENRGRAVANSVTQKNKGAQQGVGVVDNRPEAIVQRKLQEMANNSSEAKQTAQFQAMCDNDFVGNRPEAVQQMQLKAITQNTAGLGAAPVQLKPNDIDNTTSITLLNGEVQTPAGERDATSVAYPINTISGMGWAIPGVDLKGGHLYKREFGGNDDYSNVVPWHEDIEANFTDQFEDIYSAGWKANGKGSGDSSVDGEWTLNVKAGFSETSTNDVEQYMPAKPASGKEDPNERDRFINIIRWSMDTIPDSASASIEKGEEPNTKKTWAAPESPKGKSHVTANTDTENMKSRYNYAHKKRNYEGPLDGDVKIGYAEGKLRNGADK
ncbi:MAG: hypothetical protein JJV91_00085 [Desulfosarcina sp.]|nr:hypothetical protein [Desulfobacterales bacterium]